MYIEKMDVHRENGCTSAKTKEMYMHTARLVFTVIMALVLMGCPPPVSDNSAAPPQNGDNSNDSAQSGDNPAPGDHNPEPKARVIPYVSSGEYHTMVIKTNDSLWAFGRVIEGPRPDNLIVGGFTPVAVLTAPEGPAMTSVKQVSSGAKHTMILKTNGDLWAIGSNSNGQLGNGESERGLDVVEVTPVQVLTIAEGPAMTGVDQVSAGARHSMILKTNGELWAVGLNNSGQLGNGTNDTKSIPVPVKTATGRPMTEVDQVSAGNVHSMILKTNGELWAVGLNNKGQLGNGDDTGANKLIPVAVKQSNPDGNGPPVPMTEVDQVSAGATHTMILKENGDLWAVGDNEFGQLGDNTTENKSIPVAVKTSTGEPMTGVAQVSAGGQHSMILKTNGDLWAVGRNHNGQLGDGTTDQRLTPVAVKQSNPDGNGPPVPMTEVAQVSAGGSHTIIVKENGTIWAVGSNSDGQLGNGRDSQLGNGRDSNEPESRELIPVEITVR